MQPEDINSILAEINSLSESSLRKIREQEKKISGSKQIPHNSVIAAVLPVMESKYNGTGKIRPSYVEATLTGLDYAKHHRERRTGERMLDDIVAGNEINFDRYR